MDVSDVGPSARHRLRRVVKSRWQPARVPAVICSAAGQLEFGPNGLQIRGFGVDRLVPARYAVRGASWCYQVRRVVRPARRLCYFYVL
jgi:hypothetical protein